MHMHNVEVDDEIFSFVKAHAEPLEDTFNSALRRLLPLEKPNVRGKVAGNPKATPTNSSTLIPSLPTGTPQALRHILEVTQLVRRGSYTRTDATRFVAKLHDVFPQTVLDKYCRQLQLTAGQFDRLLEQERLEDLKSVLRAKFPANADVIEDTLKRDNSRI